VAIQFPLNYTDNRDATGQRIERQALTRVVGLFGDVDGNGRVQAFDAAKILEHMLSPVLAGVDSLAANVDSLALQGRVTAFDAALILQYRVGLRQRFPVQEDKAGNHPQMVEAGAAPKVGVKEYALTLRRQAGYLTCGQNSDWGLCPGKLCSKGSVQRGSKWPQDWSIF
jgi:hypothetical protein